MKKVEIFVLGGGKKMEEEKESIAAASEEVSHQFKTVINSNDVESLRQLQHLM